MNKLGVVLRELHRSELHLARDLDAVSRRHKADHEIYYVAGDVAGWSREHVRRIAEAAADMNIDLSARPRTAARAGEFAERFSDLVARRPEPSLLLLVDLRRLHQRAAGVSIDWELLAQGAQATKNADLLELASQCHPETLRQLRWTNSMLKVLSPQALI
ncbi:hypothetical protein ACPXB3_18045 [Gordonia sp. DT219]|uniref:hypothetical protein n=1 Tax=Gordonia sp. DT219 TaxID=3416658 RepID=UPI003CF7E625